MPKLFHIIEDIGANMSMRSGCEFVTSLCLSLSLSLFTRQPSLSLPMCPPSHPTSTTWSRHHPFDELCIRVKIRLCVHLRDPTSLVCASQRRLSCLTQQSDESCLATVALFTSTVGNEVGLLNSPFKREELCGEPDMSRIVHRHSPLGARAQRWFR